jgi:hypothetical protein
MPEFSELPAASLLRTRLSSFRRSEGNRGRQFRKLGEQRIIAQQRVRLIRISLRTDAPLIHKTRHTPMDTFCNAGDLGITRRPNTQ